MVNLQRTEVNVYMERAYCDPPCGEELKLTSSATGAVKTRYYHKCKNNHMAILDSSYPGRVYLPVREPEVVRRKPTAKHCTCEIACFSTADKPLNVWWRCLNCKGLVWVGTDNEPLHEMEWED